MDLRGRSIGLLKRIKEKATSTLRELASDLSIPKSSVHRHLVNQEKRIAKTGHDFFETDAGVEWLRRLFFAVILIFGTQSGRLCRNFLFFLSKFRDGISPGRNYAANA